jgi:hypothetical protein
MISHTFRARRIRGAFAMVFALVAAVAGPAGAAPQTICTITINSSDEKEAFGRHLPRDRYRLVELVQRGRPDWLAAACAQGVRCDALVISGHFDDGSEFYTDRFDDREFLTMHELQRASCSASCNGLFEQLKEVYLFGCNTLKADPRYTATGEIARSLVRAGQAPAEAERLAALLGERHGQSNRDRLRHVFQGVPVLYGFSSAAPLGRTARPLLDRYFQTAPAGEVAGGKASATLLGLFAPTSMIAVEGLREADPHAAFRRDMCALADDRPGDADKLAFMHRVLRRDMGEVRPFLDHLERFLGSVGPARRLEPSVAAALAAIEADKGTRQRALVFARDADEAGVTLRMVSLARQLGWLTPAEEQAEFLRMLADRMGRGRLGLPEVDLACGSPLARGPELARTLLATGAPRIDQPAHAAVLACLGSAEAHARTLRSLTTGRPDDVAVAQAYLRHRPLASVDELRAIASGIARMGAAGAQVRALESLARQKVADAQSLQVIAGLFPQARSLEVQRAIAGILVRSDTTLLAQRAELARTLRQHRVKSPDGSDVIDLLIRMLQQA